MGDSVHVGLVGWSTSQYPPSGKSQISLQTSQYHIVIISWFAVGSASNDVTCDIVISLFIDPDQLPKD